MFNLSRSTGVYRVKRENPASGLTIGESLNEMNRKVVESFGNEPWNCHRLEHLS